MKFRFLSLFLLIIFTLAIFPGKIFADSDNSISVDILPSNPEPRKETTVSLSSYTYNLDSVSIAWLVNGKTGATGIGKKSFSVIAPAAGVEMNIVARISLPSGLIEKRIALRSATTTLLWQANDSYVPPFYRGKALPSAGSEIKIVAMPEIRGANGTLVDPKNMTYTWKKDYNNAQDGSGYGKNFLLFVNDYLEDSNNISVVATTLDQKFSGEASVEIRSFQPKILFYKKDATLGTLWNKSLANHMINRVEILEAAPYFISPKELLHPSLIWSWLINDTIVETNSFEKNLMPLQVEEGAHGISRLKLEIENSDKIFQTTEREINIEF